MKQIFSIFLIASSIMHAYATQSDDVFNKANTLYQKGAFEEAYATYKTIQPATNSIHFNLGNCAFKLGKKGTALAHWRRAELNWGFFGREELRHNIALLKNQLTVDKEKSEPATISQSLATLYHGARNILVPFVRAIPLLHVQIIVLITWILLFACLRFFRKRIAKPIIIMLFTLFACSASTLALKYNLNNKVYGVIIQPQAPLLSGPGDNFSLLGQLPEATELVILKQSGDFYKIRHTGKLGWINKALVDCL